MTFDLGQRSNIKMPFSLISKQGLGASCTLETRSRDLDSECARNILYQSRESWLNFIHLDDSSILYIWNYNSFVLETSPQGWIWIDTASYFWPAEGKVLWIPADQVFVPRLLRAMHVKVPPCSGIDPVSSWSLSERCTTELIGAVLLQWYNTI